MTVCIAAFAENARKLILISDSRVSFGNTSADNAAVKNIPVWKDYVALIAGNDVASAQNVIDRAQKRMKIAAEDEQSSSSDFVPESIFEECQSERERIIEASVLRKRGFDWKTFRERGASLCTDAVYFDLQSEIANVQLSLDFITAGFDEEGNAHIQYTNWNTPPQNYDLIGFCAIGSGAAAALSSYMHATEHLGAHRFATAEHVFYHALAAKFMAEAAQDVGRNTFSVIVESGKMPRHVLSYQTYIDLRKQWEQFGAPRTPRAVEELISEGVKETPRK